MPQALEQILQLKKWSPGGQQEVANTWIFDILFILGVYDDTGPLHHKHAL